MLLMSMEGTLDVVVGCWGVKVVLAAELALGLVSVFMLTSAGESSGGVAGSGVFLALGLDVDLGVEELGGRDDTGAEGEFISDAISKL